MSRKGWGFTTLKLESVESVGPVFKKLRFQLPEGSSLAMLPLTSAILTFSRPNGSFFPVIRPYTPITRPDDKGFIDLLVKQYPNGKASTHLHSLQPGDTLSVAGPIPGYAWKPNEQPHVNLVAGGAGITPMYQLIQGILGNADETTKIKLIYGANTEAELVLRDELTALEKKFPDRFHAVYTVSDPATAESSDTHKGRITKELLEAELARPGKVFVCGPPAMEQSLVGTKGLLWGKSGVLQELGYSKSEIYKF
ncbi:unnamed protein product [Parascedosporium putredinis]|uniref:FAD-binding FR-type domain-containing protein n=1 Tax=Parascedosporium putredinis TaxID=1442378 RepID=A0A9P1M715_9PEZI|nr:unnamed protein product [Parascedosporium putredinis]CAI7989568.1 unnamed protein product [Parascedosporium putredinis]